MRTAVCLAGSVEVEIGLRGRVRLRAGSGDLDRWPAADGQSADAVGAGVTVRLHSDLPLGVEGNAVKGRHVLQQGETAFCGAVLGERRWTARPMRGRGSAAGCHH